jgi:hypothetical protein
MTFAHAETAIHRTAIRYEQHHAVRVAVNQPRYRAEEFFCKRVRNLHIVLKLPDIRNALPPDGIPRPTDQACIIAGHLAGID